jgi:hypothetical protein
MLADFLALGKTKISRKSYAGESEAINITWDRETFLGNEKAPCGNMQVSQKEGLKWQLAFCPHELALQNPSQHENGNTCVGCSIL